MHKILVHAQHSCACTTLLCMLWARDPRDQRPKKAAGHDCLIVPQTDFICKGSGGFDREPLAVVPHGLGGYRIDFVARRGTW